jgi:glycosyltransferase involved in cell wall biosynthesis
LVSHALRNNMPIDLSVVIGSVASERSIRDCLTSVVASCASLGAEVIVVDASSPETASLVRRYFPAAKLICLPRGTLTPILWSAGIASAKGKRIATTTGHFVVPDSWARDLSAALDAGATGAGGPVALRSDASLVDRAIYYLRYSAFLPTEAHTVDEVSEIAGDNAMYERSVFEEHQSLLAGGFSEVALHRAMRVKGQRLVMVQSATAEFGKSFPLALISRHRFAHGRHFGAWRVRQTGISASRIVVTAPAVPFLLLVRSARRVLRRGRDMPGFLMAVPLILWLAACWAVGEALGAMQSRAGQTSVPDLEEARAHRD